MHDLAAFMAAKQSAGLSACTLDWYERMIRRYLDWCHIQTLEKEKPETVEAFLAGLRELDRSAFTIASFYRALSVYFGWLVQRERLERAPTDKVEPPRTPRTRKRHVTAGEFRRLFNSIEGDNWMAPRDRAIFATLMYTGLRASELLGVRLADIDRIKLIIHINSAKGGQDRDVPFAQFLLDLIDAYLEVCPKHPSKRLWLAAADRYGEARGPLAYDGLKEIMRRRCEAAGMRRLGLHTFRHGYAMLFLNDGEMELPMVSKILGHSSVDITRRFYADFVTSSLSRAYDKAIRRMDLEP